MLLKTFFWQTYTNFNIFYKLLRIHFKLKFETFSAFQNEIFGLKLVQRFLAFGCVTEFVFSSILRRISVIWAGICQQTRCDVLDFNRHISVGANINVYQDSLVKFYLVFLESCLAINQVGNVIQLYGDRRPVIGENFFPILLDFRSDLVVVCWWNILQWTQK